MSKTADHIRSFQSYLGVLVNRGESRNSLPKNMSDMVNCKLIRMLLTENLAPSLQGPCSVSFHE